jgi:hypothetical protein
MIDIDPNSAAIVEGWRQAAIARKDCQQCNHCGWEPDSDLYCGHPEAFAKISCFGASLDAMERENLCTFKGRQLWEQREP